MLQRGGKVVCKVVRDTSYKSLTVHILKKQKEQQRYSLMNGADIKPSANFMSIISLTMVTDNMLTKMLILTISKFFGVNRLI